MNDRQQFERFYKEYARAIYLKALKRTKNPKSAQDLAAESWAKAWRYFGTFKKEGCFSAWITRILHYTYVDWCRAKGRSPSEIDIDSSSDFLDQASAPSAEKEVLDRFVDPELLLAIQNLPPAARQVLILVDLKQMSYSKVSKLTGAPMGTIRSRLFRARRAIQKQFPQMAA